MSWVLFFVCIAASCLIGALVGGWMARRATPEPEHSYVEDEEVTMAPVADPEPDPARRGKKKSTLVAGMPAAHGPDPTKQRTRCTRHRDRDSDWTCRFCRDDFCVDCQLDVDGVYCCVRKECRAKAARLAARGRRA